MWLTPYIFNISEKLPDTLTNREVLVFSKILKKGVDKSYNIIYIKGEVEQRLVKSLFSE